MPQPYITAAAIVYEKHLLIYQSPTDNMWYVPHAVPRPVQGFEPTLSDAIRHTLGLRRCTFSNERVLRQNFHENRRANWVFYETYGGYGTLAAQRDSKDVAQFSPKSFDLLELAAPTRWLATQLLRNNLLGPD